MFAGIYSQSAMENYKSLEAHNFFHSGWVQTVYLHKTSIATVLKAAVRPSYRINDRPPMNLLHFHEKSLLSKVFFCLVRLPVLVSCKTIIPGVYCCCWNICIYNNSFPYFLFKTVFD